MQKIVLLLLLAFVALAAADLLTIRASEDNKRQSGCSASSCPSGETCCVLSGGQVGCCPAANACCCPDQQHCCGTGQCVCTGGSCTGCAQTGQCANSKRSLFEVTRE